MFYAISFSQTYVDNVSDSAMKMGSVTAFFTENCPGIVLVQDSQHKQYSIAQWKIDNPITKKSS